MAVLALLLALTSACTPSVSAPPPAPTAAPPTVSRPTRAPSATAQQFELRPSSTPLPTNTPIARRPAPPLAVGGQPANYNPLVGQLVADPTLLDRRPIVVKVTNFPRSVRPQSGLSRADNVFEYYLETGLTRFIGIFYGNDVPQAGPVRSGRFFDENVVRMYRGIFVFGYADDRVMDYFVHSDLKNRLVIERGDNCPPLCRSEKIGGYNNVFLDTSQMNAYLAGRGTDNTRQDLTAWTFRADPTAGNPAARLSIRYSASSYHLWEYDPAVGRYLRYQDTQQAAPQDNPDPNPAEILAPLTDILTQEQLSADNVVVLMLSHDYFLKSNSTTIFEMPFMGEGPAYALRDGVITPIVWRRAAPEQIFQLVYPNSGRPYALKPGQTWFEVVGLASSLTQWSDGTWRVMFDIP
jgi:hypothetical protein